MKILVPFKVRGSSASTSQWSDADLAVRGLSLLFLLYCAAMQQKQRSRRTKRRKVMKKTDSATSCLQQQVMESDTAAKT